jgi:hypothetical protein
VASPDVPESIAAAFRVVRLLESLGVRYVIGGSFASSVHGVIRGSVDVDLLAELEPEHVAPFCRALKDDFYVDESRVKDAVERGGSFNVIELRSMFKVDVFVAGGEPFAISELERGVTQLLWKDPPVSARIASAEDTILSKLDWFRRGGEVSERQWTDVLGVIRVRGDELDFAYLRRFGAALSVSDLLERALEQGRD